MSSHYLGYIGPNGLDSNPGTEESPMLSLGKVIHKIENHYADIQAFTDAVAANTEVTIHILGDYPTALDDQIIDPEAAGVSALTSLSIVGASGVFTLKSALTINDKFAALQVRMSALLHNSHQ